MCSDSQDILEVRARIQQLKDELQLTGYKCQDSEESVENATTIPIVSTEFLLFALITFPLIEWNKTQLAPIGATQYYSFYCAILFEQAKSYDTLKDFGAATQSYAHDKQGRSVRIMGAFRL